MILRLQNAAVNKVTENLTISNLKSKFLLFNETLSVVPDI